MLFSSKKCFIALFSICISASLFAQKMNYGLDKPQPENTLPVSKANYVKPVLKKNYKPVTVLQPVGFNEVNITKGWQLISANNIIADGKSISTNNYNASSWYNATVPGTVLTTLVERGVYADPYFGLNNLQIPDTLCRQQWWYRSSFIIPAVQKNKRVHLNFNGINYRAVVWVNGNNLGTINGAFMRGSFDVTKYIKYTGNNIVAVNIIPPPHPGIPHEESEAAGMGPNGGQLCLDGPTFISSEGWDWMPGIRDRNIGLWQNVTLKFSDAVTIKDPFVISKLPLPDTTSAALTVKAKIVNHTSQIQAVTIKAAIGNEVNISKSYTLKPNETREIVFNADEFAKLNIKNPKLWWPNGYGKPNLYKLQLFVYKNKTQLIDKIEDKFGIREISYELSAGTENNIKRYELNPVTALANGEPIFNNEIKSETKFKGTLVPALIDGAENRLKLINEDGNNNPFIVFKVNGVKIYCKGGNWGMDDAMKNVSKEKMEPYIKLHQHANFNMIRNWTGESTENVFYELCDKYGIMVWNDFWMSTGGYNLYPLDDSLFLDNAKETIVRFRNHPSVVLWCARNEGYPEAFIENGLANLIAKYDGTRHYQPNSRNLNIRNSGPWHYFVKPAEYFKTNAEGFNSELGTPSFPEAHTMRKFLAKEDQWPVNDVWYYHDLHDGQKTFRKSLDSLYGTAISLDDFAKKAQFLNYESHRAMFESWNSKLWQHASGLLLWMTHPAWPSMVWQTYSWDYETFGSYFGSLKACEPVHIQQNLHTKKIDIINASQKALLGATVKVFVYDINGKELASETTTLDAAANKKTEVNINVPEFKNGGSTFNRLVLINNKGEKVSINEYWNTGADNTFKDFNTLAKSSLEVKEIKFISKTKISFVISNKGNGSTLNVKPLINTRDNKEVLPVYFSDAYFSLLAGEERLITAEIPSGNLSNLKISTSSYN